MAEAEKGDEGEMGRTLMFAAWNFITLAVLVRIIIWVMRGKGICIYTFHYAKRSSLGKPKSHRGMSHNQTKEIDNLLNDQLLTEAGGAVRKLVVQAGRAMLE